MARINLLPWRAERRKQREREFYMTLGLSAVAAFGVFLLGVLWMDERIDNQEQVRNKLLKDEITALDSKLAEIKELEKTKSKLLARKQIIEQLQASRSQMVHLFDELVKTIPDGVRLSSMKQAGDTLTLEGVAQSNASVATYMRNLDNSTWLARSDLQKTEAKGEDKKNRFTFALNVKLRKQETQDEHAAAGPAAGAGAAKKPDVAAPAGSPVPPATTAPAPSKSAPASAGGKS